MSDLDYAWRIDYHRQPTPMRILVVAVAGLNDLIKGGTKETVMEGIKELTRTIATTQELQTSLPWPPFSCHPSWCGTWTMVHPLPGTPTGSGSWLSSTMKYLNLMPKMGCPMSPILIYWVFTG